jgi:hypothetical protein
VPSPALQERFNLSRVAFEEFRILEADFLLLVANRFTSELPRPGVKRQDVNFLLKENNDGTQAPT